MLDKRQVGLWCLLSFLLAACAFASGQSEDTHPIPSLVEVYWHSSRTVVIPGISSFVVLDQNIATAELGEGTVRFVGLDRGETVALGYVNGKPQSIRVRVVERPEITLPPSLGRAEMAQGMISSSLQQSSVSGTNTLAATNNFSWTQLVGRDGHFSFTAQTEEANYQGGHVFDPRTATLRYQSRTLDVQALDFTVNLTNSDTRRYMGPFTYVDAMVIRGLGVTSRKGRNEYSLYAGTTLPSYYLMLGATRDLVGVSVKREQTNKLTLLASTSFVNAPIDTFGLTSGRRNNLMDLAGLSYLLNDRWTLQATTGISNHGGMARSAVSYVGDFMTLFATGSTSTALFPLNQIESIYSGTSAYKAGWTLKSNNWLSESINYQHTVTQSAYGVIRAGSSDYVSPGINFRPVNSQDVSFTYTYSRNNGGFSNESSTGNRFDINLNSHIGHRVTNSVQVDIGSIQDLLQVSSENQFSLQDSVSFPVKVGNLYVGAYYSRTNPSLVSKLSSELSLLAPALQALYLQDPVSFVDSPNLPPEIKALLESQQPKNISFSGSGQFRVGNKLTFSPNVSVAQTSDGITNSWSPFISYGLSYLLRPTLMLTSSMSNSWYVGGKNNMAQRVNVVAFGVTKTFTAAPLSLGSEPSGRVIEGHVFRDDNINGVYNSGKPGLAGIRVRLDNGQLVVTGKDGYFRFVGVSAAVHQVSINSSQFDGPVRLTCANEQEADVIRTKTSSVDFGVVNFARLMGQVFNDLRFEDVMQPDSKGMQQVHLILDDGTQKRTIVTGGTGEYQVDDILPGDYQLSIDSSTLPANYITTFTTASVHVKPISTVLHDIPLRALRSISGRVLLKIPEANAADKTTTATKLVPLRGVQLTAGYGIVKTDENGAFLLRNLPAGDLNVSVVPVMNLPQGMTVPSGKVHMPTEPIEVQGATIVIGNPDLVPYLVGKSNVD